MAGLGAVADVALGIVAGDLSHHLLGAVVRGRGEGRQVEGIADLNAGLGAHLLHFRVQFGDLVQQPPFPIGRVLPRHHAEAKREPALLGGDVLRRAAADLPDVHVGVGRGEERRHWPRLASRVLGVDRVAPVDELGTPHDGRDAGLENRAVHLDAVNMHLEADAALVASHRLQHGRLAHDHGAGFRHHPLHRRDEIDRPLAADLLVITERQLQRPRHAPVPRLDQSPDRQSVECLHVRRAAPVKPPLPLGERERIRAPVLPLDRHHVRVPRQHHTALGLGADMGKERCLQLGLGGLGVAVALDPVAGKIRLGPVDQIEVGSAAHGGKGNELLEKRARG